MDNRPFSDISYEQFLGEKSLMGTRCRSCGKIFTPPRALCNNCFSTAMEWSEMAGVGSLLAFTCIHLGVKFMLEEGFDRHNPYCVGVVELDEGARVNGRIIGVDAKNPESIKVGTRLKASFVPAGEGDTEKIYLAFEPI